MKSSKIDRIISVVVISTCLIKAVLYGGSKPPATNEVETVGGGGESNLTSCAFGLQRVGAVHCPPPPHLFTSLTAWNKRGAFCDWVPITFPDGFEFPYGTNMLNGITLMAYGELRENLHCSPSPSAFTLNLPQLVSIEPDNSSVSYGLTPSNTYLFTWQNVCVNRDPTNRVDASIELFDSGAIATTVTSLSTPTPPTYTYQPAVPPEGFVGEGQDTNWLAAAFSPTDYAAITNKGYEAWLMEDEVGINEPNGIYKVDVTVAALPDHGPCYLVVGPYKTVVTAPGTYSFPLEVFEEYQAYTCPTRVPLSFAYDDGCREEGMRPPTGLRAPLRSASHDVPDYYIVCMVPEVYVFPSHVPLEEAVGTRIGLWCNCPGGTWDYRSYFSEHLRLTFGFPSSAEIETAEVADRVIVIMRAAGHECSGVFFIDPPSSNGDDPPHHTCCNACCGDACRCDGTCCLCNCGCHSSSNSSTNATETTP